MRETLCFYLRLCSKQHYWLSTFFNKKHPLQFEHTCPISTHLVVTRWQTVSQFSWITFHDTHTHWLVLSDALCESEIIDLGSTLLNFYSCCLWAHCLNFPSLFLFDYVRVGVCFYKRHVVCIWMLPFVFCMHLGNELSELILLIAKSVQKLAWPLFSSFQFPRLLSLHAHRQPGNDITSRLGKN